MEQVIIRNNDLLFLVSDLPFHLSKIISCSKQWKGALMRLRHSNFSDLVMLLTMMLFLVYITTPRLLFAAYRCRTNFWLYRDICALRDNAVKKSVNDADHCMEVYSRGVARIFQRGGHRQGHHPGIADYIWFIPLLSLVYQRAQSYYRRMKAYIN